MTNLFKLFSRLIRLLNDDAPLGRISPQRAEHEALRQEMDTHPVQRGPNCNERLITR